jgi:Mrp family chromosome partitioning ATPase
VRVLQAAVPPIHSQSRRAMILAAGLGLGLIAAAAVVVLSVAIFQGMLTPKDVEQKLALPVVLVLNNKPDAISAASPDELPGPAHLTIDHAEMINQLVRTINPASPNSVQLIGPDDGVGVTSILLDLALLSENERRRVLIIDAEPFKGRSVADLLTQRGAVLTPVDDLGKVVRVNESNLFLTGLKHDGESQMSEQRWQQALEKMRGHFDLILIDSPALMRSPAGLLTAPCVDLTLAVIEAEQTHTAAARNMIERIASVGGAVTAAIFNKRRFYLPQAVYDAL